MKRVAIVGGGISGLVAAFSLEKQKSFGAAVEYILFESGSRFGGVIQTENVDGCIVEGGPDSFLTEKPWAADLCRELGLGDQLIGSNDGQRKTYILVGTRLVPLPDGLQFMVPTQLSSAFFSPLFSWGTKMRILREWFYRGNFAGEDSTVTEFVERHYGREMVERVADPLLAGIYGGSANELSTKSVLPRFLDMEAKHGSLGRAMVATRKQRSAAQVANPTSLFTSLEGGMQTMVDALLARIPATARRLNVEVQAVRRESGKWLVIGEGRTQEFDAVVLAAPAHAATRLLNATNAELAAELKSIAYSSSVTVVLGFDKGVRASLPPGFGFLVPRSLKRRVLAATFVHNKFLGRAPEDRALVRCFLGGTGDEEILQRSDDEVVAIVLGELRAVPGINAKPLLARVFKWPRAMAQYGVGHGERVERICGLVAAMPGLALAGNAYGGIGVPDCVREGTKAAHSILQGN